MPSGSSAAIAPAAPRAAALAPRDASITLAPRGGFGLKHGGALRSVRVAATFYGLGPEAAPTILVCHALTGSSRAAEWWGDVIGPGKLLDTDRYCIACANALGGCYGSTGPTSVAPGGEPWGSRFPVVTVEDTVRAHREAFALLGVRRFHAVIGGSLGGMQALRWGDAYPEAVERVVAIGASGSLSPMALGLNAVARAGIALEPHGGLRLARMIAMLSYKSAALLTQRHGRRWDRDAEDPGSALHAKFDIEGYLRHQGEKLASRMDALSYAYLTKAMDLYALDPAGWRVPALLVGIGSDWLYPPSEVRATAASLGPLARYAELESDHGHDGFLADAAQLAAIVAPFLDNP